MNNSWTIVSILVLVLIINIVGSAKNVFSDNINPGVFPVNSSPYGLTYSDWSVKWWQWFLSFNQDDSPFNDPTGTKCTLGQTDPHAWFLIATQKPSTVSRTCTVPHGIALVVPISANECSYKEFPATTNLIDCAVSGNQVSDHGIEVDGIKFHNLTNYRIQTPVFNVTMADNNVFTHEGGKTKAASDMYLFVLEPLSTGNHSIHYYHITDIPNYEGNFRYDVTYHLSVLP